MGIIYYIIKILTFPGALFKAFMEHLTCRMYEIPVEYSKYIQKNELCGHIEHVLAPHKGSFGICFMPHIISLFCGLILTTSASINLFYLGKINIFSIIFIYFGISFLTNCFPLFEDAVNMWDNLFGKDANSNKVSKIFLAIPAAIMYGGAWLEEHSITILTSIAFAYGIPYFIALFIN